MRNIIFILTFLLMRPAVVYACDLVELSTDETLHNDDDAYVETFVNFNPEKFELIHKIAITIHKWKLKHDGDVWIECGKRIKNKTRSMKRAWLYAWSIVDAAESVSDAQFTLIPWSLVAIYSNESVFDRCAMGPGPREWAYRRGIMKKKRTMLSHSERQILDVITSSAAKRAFSRSGFDLGPCQLLSRFYNGDPANMMSVYEGSKICAREARKRCVRHGIAQPQLFWPGRRSRWYQSRVNQRVRRMGISIAEQFDSESLYYNRVDKSKK